LKVDRRRPLSDLDTEFQTLGCRSATPENCRNNRTERKCAFVREDNMCHLVPRSWKRLFEELSRKKATVDNADKDAPLEKTDGV